MRDALSELVACAITAAIVISAIAVVDYALLAAWAALT